MHKFPLFLLENLFRGTRSVFYKQDVYIVGGCLCIFGQFKITKIHSAYDMQKYTEYLRCSTYCDIQWTKQVSISVI